MSSKNKLCSQQAVPPCTLHGGNLPGSLGWWIGVGRVTTTFNLALSEICPSLAQPQFSSPALPRRKVHPSTGFWGQAVPCSHLGLGHTFPIAGKSHSLSGAFPLQENQRPDLQGPLQGFLRDRAQDLLCAGVKATGGSGEAMA